MRKKPISTPGTDTNWPIRRQDQDFNKVLLERYQQKRVLKLTVQLVKLVFNKVHMFSEITFQMFSTWCQSLVRNLMEDEGEEDHLV